MTRLAGVLFPLLAGGPLAAPGIPTETAPRFELAGGHPAPEATGVRVSSSVHLRFSEPVDLETLPELTLHRLGGGEPVKIDVGASSDLTGASITLSPAEFLEPGAVYEVRGTQAVRSRTAKPLVPFLRRFTTSREVMKPDERLVFTLERFDGTRSMTTVLFGPDRRLYAADAFGSLVCWDVAPDGRPSGKRTLLADPTRSRQYIDLEWDPDAAAGRLVLWATYGERLAPRDSRHHFTGTVARLTLGDGVREEVVLRGLPHGREEIGGFESLPHQPNGLVFRDGMLYQSVGSTSSSGGPPNWGVVEQLLSACIIEIDYRRLLAAPLDVHPETRYDPAAPSAPVRIFATGVRNALEIVAHTNGRLYTATNINDRAGRGDGVPDDPDIEGDQNALVTHTTPDHECLYLLERGRHYGFPNPARGQYVLGGGNPTAGEDPFEIPDYPVGTQPEPGFAPELCHPIWMYGGTSPDGMIEYLPELDHPLRGALLVCFFSAGDIAAMPLGPDGLPAAVDKLRAPEGKLRLAGPLDITQDAATGVLYIADFGKQGSFGADGSMVLLRPALRPPRASAAKGTRGAPPGQ
jgi:hypothetical protein